LQQSLLAALSSGAGLVAVNQKFNRATTLMEFGTGTHNCQGTKSIVLVLFAKALKQKSGRMGFITDC
jgi:dihydroxyacetone kinase